MEEARDSNVIKSDSDLVRQQLTKRSSSRKKAMRKTDYFEEDVEINIEAMGNVKLPMLMACATRDGKAKARKDIVDDTYFYNERELRRLHLPLHICILAELEEDGLQNAADYLHELLRENEEILAMDDIGIAMDIKKSSVFLNWIDEGLREVSAARSNGDKIDESTAFLKVALRFAEADKGVLWVAEKFFLLACVMANETKLDGGEQESKALYARGRFLLDKFPSADMTEADVILKKARSMSNAKHWDLPDFVIQKEKVRGVFENASTLLHRILICRARNIRPYDPRLAQRLTEIAKRRGHDANDLRLITIAVIESGNSQMNSGDRKTALSNFLDALDLALQSKYANDICEAYVHVSSAYLKNGDDDAAVEALTNLGSIAVSTNLQSQLGRALQLLGELHLSRGRPHLAATHLSEAFGCYTNAVDSYAMCKKRMILSEIFKEDEEDMKQEEEPYDDVKEEGELISETLRAKFGQEVEPSTEVEQESNEAEDDTVLKEDSESEMKLQASIKQVDTTEEVIEKVTDLDVDNEVDEGDIDLEQEKSEVKGSKTMLSVTGEAEITTSKVHENIEPGELPTICHCYDEDVPEVLIEEDEQISEDVEEELNPWADLIVESDEDEIDLSEDAEQARFLNAVAAAQYRIEWAKHGFFDMIKKSDTCNVAREKMNAWKLNKQSWAFGRKQDAQIACLCPEHERTALDVVMMNLREKTKLLRRRSRGENKVFNLLELVETGSMQSPNIIFSLM